MKEDLIQFIWNSKTLSLKQLNSTSGELIEIIYPGNQNQNQGPDFLFAKIKINHILWVGHVEIHVNASDWLLHNHQKDPNYQNTILHVVWENDQPINWSGRPISCLEIKSLMDLEILDNYRCLMENRQKIPCQSFLEHIHPIIKTLQIERLMMDRLEEKTEQYKTELASIQWDWEAMLFKKIAHYLMAPINGEAMDSLWQHLPYTLIGKIVHDPIQLAALFFGTAGLLKESLEDEYYRLLQDEYRFLQRKFQVQPMDGFEWKLLRLRPSHFPAIRIAQFLAILSKQKKLFTSFLESQTIAEAYILLDAIPEEYWNTHYTFNKSSKSSRKPTLGKQTKDIVLINAICPLIFAYGSVYQIHGIMEKAIYFLQNIKPESNHISHMWKNFNFVLDHAGHSQGSIQLYRKYCLEKKCTSCSIGNEILSKKPMEEILH